LHRRAIDPLPKNEPLKKIEDLRVLGALRVETPVILPKWPGVSDGALMRASRVAGKDFVHLV
jgi:hypothetical protein